MVLWRTWDALHNFRKKKANTQIHTSHIVYRDSCSTRRTTRADSHGPIHTYMLDSCCGQLISGAKWIRRPTLLHPISNEKKKERVRGVIHRVNTPTGVGTAMWRTIGSNKQPCTVLGATVINVTAGLCEEKHQLCRKNFMATQFTNTATNVTGKQRGTR